MHEAYATFTAFGVGGVSAKHGQTRGNRQSGMDPDDAIITPLETEKLPPIAIHHSHHCLPLPLFVFAFPACPARIIPM